MVEGVRKILTVFSAIVCCTRGHDSNFTFDPVSSYATYSSWLLSAENPNTRNNVTIPIAFLHCNVYCNGTTKTRITHRPCSRAMPQCKPCRCDQLCYQYDDCCPDEDGGFNVNQETRYRCVGATDNVNIIGSLGGYFMITTCPKGSNIEVSSGSAILADISPVTSLASNVTYISSNVAACNDDTHAKPWGKKKICRKSKNKKNSLSTRKCFLNVSPDMDIHVRDCSPQFSNRKYIDTCNSTGLWDGSTFDVDADIQCRYWQHYPVSGGGYVFKNIYCFLCNGLKPSVTPCTRFGVAASPGGVTMNDLVNTQPEKPSCKVTEWYDTIKNVCRNMNCRPGYELDGEECKIDTTRLQDVEFYFSADYWPQKPIRSDLESWDQVETMVVQNIHPILSAYNVSDCVFTLYNIVDKNHDNVSEPVPSFGLYLLFRTNQSCCRVEYQNEISTLFKMSWTMLYNGSSFIFAPLKEDNSHFEVQSSQTYKVISPIEVPEKVGMYKTLSEYVGPASLYVPVPTTFPDCSYVYLYIDDFNWKTDKAITLDYAPISIHSDNFTEVDEKVLAICIDTLKEVYKTYDRPEDFVKRAETIVSVFFSILSLICLALTFITYCTFRSLLTLPTRNTMCLVVFLFIAQLLLQFGGVAAGDETTCKVLGVLIHYFWLSVICWMNVCSYHMFHVFVIDAAKPIGSQNNCKRLLKYFLYANGSPILIVLITITASLGTTSGEQIGYGNGNCYLSTALLTGVSFVLPLGIILILNIIYFGFTVWTIAKIQKSANAIGQERSQVHIYMKLSTLTGVFWVVSILAVNLNQQVLIFISIVLNASQGVFIFISYTANRRIYRMWRGKMGTSSTDSHSSKHTVSTHL